MVSQKQEQSLLSFTSITKRVNDIHTLKLNLSSRPYFGKRNLSIFCLERERCGSLIKRQKQRSSSTNTSNYPVYPQKHIAMSSTVERHWNGLLTDTKSKRTRTVASSITQTVGSRTLVISSRRLHGSFM